MSKDLIAALLLLVATLSLGSALVHVAVTVANWVWLEQARAAEAADVGLEVQR